MGWLIDDCIEKARYLLEANGIKVGEIGIGAKAGTIPLISFYVHNRPNEIVAREICKRFPDTVAVDFRFTKDDAPTVLRPGESITIEMPNEQTPSD